MIIFFIIDIGYLEYLEQSREERYLAEAIAPANHTIPTIPTDNKGEGRHDSIN